MRLIGCAGNADSRWTVKVVLLLALAILGAKESIGEDNEGLISFPDESDVCTFQPGWEGVCQSAASCSWTKLLIRKHYDIPHCEFIGTEPIVCCPKNLTGVELAIKLSEEVPSLHELTYHIHNGQPADLPFVAALGYSNQGSDKSAYKWHCGSILISHSYLLTAAHCVFNNNTIYFARMGHPDVPSVAHNGIHQYRQIEYLIKHPEYRSKEKQNDIALAKVMQPFIFVPEVNPVCLPNSLEDKDKILKLHIAGWGSTENMKKSNKLLWANVTTVPISKCREAYEQFPQVGSKITDQHYCAIGNNETDISDACWGDSGGPLFTSANISGTLKYQLIGIISKGVNCGSRYPGVYVYVGSYLDWIASHVKIEDVLKLL
ncbi:AGAP000571-PA-like protein [Anopheles sinensis]|uniref:AGAP000571-PA-like protein n=1 Tax=Anopheles sinensis TaxID=74873 RepID=A0A084VFM2_ANOSI|nr:AGAP000571-PA-like protein [Anopheles sinensis]